MAGRSGTGAAFCDGMSRRSMLQVGALAMGGLSLPDLLHTKRLLDGDRTKR